jgi:hypothetical protein
MIGELAIVSAWLAIIGFWFAVTVFILKKPIGDALASRIAAKETDQKLLPLNSRIADLEAQIGTMERELHQVRDSTEFAVKLLADNGGAANIAAGRGHQKASV